MYDINIQSVAELLSLEFYRFKRYKVPIALVIIEIDYKNFFEVIESHIRKTDLYQQIDKNLYAILYSHTNGEGAHIAIKNILASIQLDSCHIRLSIEEGRYDDMSEQVFVERTFSKLGNYELGS